MREAEGRLGPRNLEGEARKYAGPYPRAAKGEGAGEVGEGGAKTRDDYAELREARSARPVGRSFAAASGGNRRSGSPMSKGGLQAVA